MAAVVTQPNAVIYGAHLNPAHSSILQRKSSPLPELLYDLLTRRSPSGKEDRIRAMLIEEIKKIKDAVYEVDQQGNLWAWVGGKKVHRTLFSAHMDTVHDEEGRHRLVSLGPTAGPGKEGMIYAATVAHEYEYAPVNTEEYVPEFKLNQAVHKDGGKYYRIQECIDGAALQKYPGVHLKEVHSLQEKSQVSTPETLYGYFKAKMVSSRRKGSVLGADDKLGCYTLIELMRKGVHAIYIFHVKEETGGGGSRFIADNLQDRLKGVERAIAFDRANYGDVICQQRHGVCCSVEFGRAMADLMNEHMPPMRQYRGGVVGTFTDTANYIRHIPECTNLSVGYFSQHGTQEHYDSVFFADIFLPAIRKIDWDKLPTVRKPGTSVSTFQGGHNYQTPRYGGRWDSVNKKWVDNDSTSDIKEDPNDPYAMYNLPPKKDDKPASTPICTDVLNENYYTDRGWIAPWKIDSKTPYEKIPHWNSSMGVFNNKCTMIQLQIVLGLWIMQQEDYVGVTRALAGTMLNLHSVQMVRDGMLKAMQNHTVEMEKKAAEVRSYEAAIASMSRENTTLKASLEKANADIKQAMEDLGWTGPTIEAATTAVASERPGDTQGVDPVPAGVKGDSHGDCIYYA